MLQKTINNFTYTGLYQKNIAHLRKLHGSNIITPAPRALWWKFLFNKLKDPIIRILLVSTIIALVFGYFNHSYTEGFGIITTVILLMIITFAYKNNKEHDIFNFVNNDTFVKVIRNSEIIKVSKCDIVLGDIVILEHGDEVPADGILLESSSLTMNESTLNGIFTPEEKMAEPVDSFLTAYSPNVALRGAIVTEGQGIMLVTAVGNNTEIGKMARVATMSEDERKPLNKKLNKLNKFIVQTSIITAMVILILLIMRDYLSGNLYFAANIETFIRLLDYFMIAATLIMVAVPEGFAMNAIMNIVYGMRQVQGINNIAGTMYACETMGEVTVICMDKTDMLTQNKMEVRDSYILQSSPLGLDMLFQYAIVANSAACLQDEHTVGDTAEGALLLWLLEHGIDYNSVMQQITILNRSLFSTEKKYVASHVRLSGCEEYIFVKGAPEIILQQCNSHTVPDNIQQQMQNYQERAMNTQAFAYRAILKNEQGMIGELLNNMTFIGFVALADTVRSDADKTIQECIKAGIKVKIVTSDTSVKAMEVARQIGLWKLTDNIDKLHITGNKFSTLSEEDAREAVRYIKVISQARTSDKLKFLKMLQLNNQVVAVTGNGINDAPMLNNANIGLSMNSSKSVTKKINNITLLNNSLSGIVNVIRYGRLMYCSIQRFIQFQLTVNVSALLVMFSGAFVGVTMPLTIMQMLWINTVICTLAAIALSTEPLDDIFMQNNYHYAHSFIISRHIWCNILLQAGIFVIILTGLLSYFGNAGNNNLRYEETVFFSMFVFLQFWNLFNIRCTDSQFSIFWYFKKNRMFFLIAALILVLQIMIIQFGGELFHVAPLKTRDLIIIIICASLVLWVGEICRWLKRKQCVIKDSKTDE